MTTAHARFCQLAAEGRETTSACSAMTCRDRRSRGCHWGRNENPQASPGVDETRRSEARSGLPQVSSAVGRGLGIVGRSDRRISASSSGDRNHVTIDVTAHRLHGLASLRRFASRMASSFVWCQTSMSGTEQRTRPSGKRRRERSQTVESNGHHVDGHMVLVARRRTEILRSERPTIPSPHRPLRDFAVATRASPRPRPRACGGFRSLPNGTLVAARHSEQAGVESSPPLRCQLAEPGMSVGR